MLERRPDQSGDKAGRLLCIAPEKVEETARVTSLGITDTKDLVRATRMIQEYDPGIIASSLGRSHILKENEVRKYFQSLNIFAKKVKTLIHLMRQWPDDPVRTYWNPDGAANNLEWYHASADLSFICSDKDMAQIV